MNAAVTITASTGRIAALIDAYNRAFEANEAAWEARGVIEEAHDFPLPKIQVGRLLLGRKDDGTEDFMPIFAYDEGDIRKHLESHLRAQLSMFSRPQDREAVQRRYEERIERLAADLRQQEEARADLERETGLAAAHAVASASSDQLDDAMDAITSACIETLHDAREIAAFLIGWIALDNGLHDPDRLLKEFVTNLAGKAVQS
ncbi:hypothetical protein [Mesorhizobium sp. M8A.F.Ca.ET.165.01.1.1]|uniref:hypothetical protein n=1 Tax=Mesorhizobium sp. M8A.F.Ca.ET.165.01.1.1 TaxID=2563960 RepID=UPI001093C82B|nr:hypothetical protein [Mesorhizobium sp. M8A.F.Ca.ET.165.01.1.1]TGT36191.1 hypothetical protein EN808_29850 [Mesorhizobium sp. M8A.F.Ca.ET.165.01.1.1]